MLIKSSMITFLLSQAVAMESAGFMNALTSAASAAPVVRKRKRVTAAKVFVYVVGVTFTLWWGLRKLFVYLFIYLFTGILLLLLFADWNNYNYNSNIFSVKYQGRWKILLMLLHNYAYFIGVAIAFTHGKLNVLLQKLFTFPPQSVFGLNLSILQKILGWLHT